MIHINIKQNILNKTNLRQKIKNVRQSKLF